MGEQFEVVVIKAGGYGARDQAKGGRIGDFGTKDRAGRDPELEDLASSDIAAKLNHLVKAVGVKAVDQDWCPVVEVPNLIVQEAVEVGRRATV